jgi:type I restriction enzyme M protein
MPDGTHWTDVRAVAANVGQALQSAFRAIEQANPDKLYGVLNDAQWTNKDAEGPHRALLGAGALDGEFA